jgi:hypothetical protein
MAKQKLNTGKAPAAAAAPAEPDGPDQADLIDGEDPSISQIQEMLESADLNKARVRISRKGPGQEKFFYVTTLDATEFDVDSIKNTYGGGDYQVVLLDQNGHYVKRRSFAVDPRIRGKLDGPAAPEAAAAAGTGESTAAFDRILAMQNDNMKFFMAMSAEQSKATAQIMAAAMGRPVSGGMDFKDLIALLPFLEKLLGKDRAAAIGPKEMIEFFKEMRELAGDGGSSGGGFAEFLEKMVPTILARFGGGQAALPAPVAPAAAADAEVIDEIAAGAPAGDRAEAPGKAAPEKPILAVSETDFDRTLKLSLSAAGRNSDVGLYCDLLIDQITDDQVDQVLNVLTQDTWMDLVFSNLKVPDRSKPWLTNLRNVLIKALNEIRDNPADAAEAGPGADNSPGVQPKQGAAGAG